MWKPKLPGRAQDVADRSAHDSDSGNPRRVAYVSWLVAAVLGGMGAVLVGWMAVAALVGVTGLDRPGIPMPHVLDVVAKGWLLMHGVQVELGGTQLSVAPLGITGLVAVFLGMATSFAAGQMDDAQRGSWRAGLQVIGTSAASYVAVAFVVATLVGAPAQGVELLRWAVPMAVVAALVGTVHGLGLRTPAPLPGWLDRSVVGAGLILAALAVGAVAALVVALVASWPRVSELHETLGHGGLASAMVVGLQLAYLPNAVAWAGSFVTGTGFAVGTGTLVSPAGSVVGLLPGLPMLGAIPAQTSPTDWLWTLVPVVACLATGWWAGRNRRVGAVAAALTGACAGLLAGVTWVAFAWLSRGDLGSQRLVDVGPVFPAAWGIVPAAVALCGVMAMATRAVRSDAPGESATEAAEVEPTRPEDLQTVPILRRDDDEVEGVASTP